MSEYEDYIQQYFYDKDGNKETNKPHECRICWIRNGYPPFKELEKICNSTYRTIITYSSRFNWDAIRQKATELKVKADLEAEQEYQQETLKRLRRTNKQRTTRWINRLKTLEERLNNPDITIEEEEKIINEMLRIDDRLHKLQEDMLRDANLPRVINDKQDHKHSGEIEVNHRLKKILKPENITQVGITYEDKS